MTQVGENIAEIRTDVKWLCKAFDEHLASHRRLKWTIYGGVSSLIIALLILLI